MNPHFYLQHFPLLPHACKSGTSWYMATYIMAGCAFSKCVWSLLVLLLLLKAEVQTKVKKVKNETTELSGMGENPTENPERLVGDTYSRPSVHCDSIKKMERDQGGDGEKKSNGQRMAKKLPSSSVPSFRFSAAPNGFDRNEGPGRRVKKT